MVKERFIKKLKIKAMQVKIAVAAGVEKIFHPIAYNFKISCFFAHS